MSEQLPIDPSRTTANRDLRWPRLVANSLWVVICFAIGSFVIDLAASVWNHKLKADLLSARVLWWFANAVGLGCSLVCSWAFLPGWRKNFSVAQKEILRNELADNKALVRSHRQRASRRSGRESRERVSHEAFVKHS